MYLLPSHFHLVSWLLFIMVDSFVSFSWPILQYACDLCLWSCPISSYYLCWDVHTRVEVSCTKAAKCDLEDCEFWSWALFALWPSPHTSQWEMVWWTRSFVLRVFIHCTFLELVWRKMFWMLPCYTVIRVHVSSWSLTWFPRLFFLVRRWSLGTRLYSCGVKTITGSTLTVSCYVQRRQGG